MTKEKVARFCPECGARIHAPEAAFESHQKCPRCERPVLFSKRRIDRPEVADQPPESPRPDVLDWTAYVFVGIALVAALIGVVRLILGDSFGMTIISVTLFGLGVVPAVAFLRFRADLIQNTAEVARLSDLVTKRTNELNTAIERWQAYRGEYTRQTEAELQRIRTETQEMVTKAERMHADADERQKIVDRLGKRLISDTRKWVQSKLTPQNFATQRDRLQKVVGFCRKHEYRVPKDFEREMLAELKSEYEAVVRKDQAKQEQARIKAQIRDEQRAERELQREMERINTEQQAIQRALDTALREAADEHSAEVEALRIKLREAEERAERSKSMAQLTKAGHIYVISNIGSFGENVYKVGMTRRLEPMDRVKELGDASVPFPFDVHMMISCDDAPSLENRLHKALHSNRVNRVNLRKEFFNIDLETIRRLVESHHGEVDYEVDPEALEYRESREMSAEDFAFVTEQREVGAAAVDEWE